MRTSVTWPFCTSVLNSLYGIARPPGVMKYICTSPSTISSARPYQSDDAARGGRPRGVPRRTPRGFGFCDVVGMCLCSHGLPLRERQRIGARVDDDRIALEEVAFEDPQRQWIEDATLDRALERPGAVCLIVAVAHELLLGLVCQLHVNLPLLQPFEEAGDLDVDDPFRCSRPRAWKK